ncbi:putative acetyltransferase [Tetragenococcus halophilus subsp. halophilus]|uniref:GNAT family N-acetyltransferase n=1 Tax=Tetragenococcus halophilus TaxID=51669 RepID=UPI000CBF918D|nr:GNAT family N-acetyltransferase [Tetragenococcus halophilus]GBD60361.1 putative acetyltransferase [Tetragenococcus halophilus subsp. halophilus]GBD80121.1 putative acetyltransferase [Tetragenococcus halophilus subsp. halophilus]
MHVIYTKDTQSNTYVNALAIRKEVFIKEQGVPVEREIDENEQQAIHFVLYNEQNEPLATVRLLPSGNNIVKVQRMAVVRQARGHHYGKVIMQEAENYASNHDYQQMTLGAQISARNFYRNLGYQEEGDIFLDAGIEHITMTKNLF